MGEGVLGEGGVEDLLELAGVGAAGGLVDEAGVGGEFGLADGAGEGGPLAEFAGQREEEVSAVAGGVEAAEGVYDFHIGTGAGGIEITDPLDGRWASGPFQAGDVLLFHSMTVHKGVPNMSDKLRMSMDVRYQRVSDPFNPDNANPDAQPLAWESIYAGWKSDAFQYYWQRLPLVLRPFDRQWFDRRDAMAFELGENHDPAARSVLQRIVARDADPAKRARAQALLASLSA